MKHNYRIWDNQEIKYFEPTFEAYKGDLEDITIGPGGGVFLRTMSGTTHCNSVMPGRFAIELSTGLKDTNGVEIFEGDIMQHPEFKVKDTGVVELVKGCFLLGGWDCVRTDFSKGEIVDNIHKPK